MSLFSNIDRIVSQKGIYAVAVDSPNNPRIFRGQEDMFPVLDRSLNLFSLVTWQTIMRIRVADYSVYLQREPTGTACTIFTTGSDICKSIHRIITSAAKIHSVEQYLSRDCPCRICKLCYLLTKRGYSNVIANKFGNLYIDKYTNDNSLKGEDFYNFIAEKAKEES